MSDRKIVQIMSAEGWGATFGDGDEEIISPLVGWALVQRGGQSEVVGLTASENKVALCDDDADFTGYVFLPDALPNDLEVEQDLFAAEDLDEDDFDDDDFDDDDDLDGTSGNGPAFNPKAGRLN
ncbi:MAG: hypothetical protein IT318_03180 [Anaerolineales bacterium]|nr:hypothetical protein [Anaerolineales bacterium]